MRLKEEQKGWEDGGRNETGDADGGKEESERKRRRGLVRSGGEREGRQEEYTARQRE